MLKKLILTTMFIMLSIVFVNAQDNVDTGSFNEATFTKSLDKKTDVFFGARLETRNDFGTVHEWRLFSGLNLKFKNGVTVIPLYTFIRNQGKNGKYTTEHRPALNVTYKLPINSKNWTVLVGARNEFRVHPVRNSYKFVPNVSVTRKLNNTYSVFERFEYWYDTRDTDPTQHRKRSVTGLSINANKQTVLEPFIMVNRDERGYPHWSFRLGLNLKFKFN